jgi:hypothetical protein
VHVRARSEHDLWAGGRPRPVRELVALVLIAITVPLLVPSAVQAVSSVVGIADNDSTTDLARVDSGKLRVGDGSGYLTVDGLVSVRDSSGPLTVDGGVSVSGGRVTPDRRAGSYNAHAFLGASTPGVVIWQSTARFNLTSILIMNVGAKTQFDLQYDFVDAAASCSSVTIWGEILRIPIAASATQQFVFPDPTPLGLGPILGKRVCIRLALVGDLTGTSTSVLWTVYGS